MKKLFLLCLLIGFTSLSAFAQFFQWAKPQEGNMGETSLASGTSLVATTGTFFQTITIGNQTFTTLDSLNAYLAVHDHNGNNLWAKHIVTQSLNQPTVAIDANQNIIIAGVFMDSLFIDGLLFKGSNANKKGIYIVKFSPTGTLLWARSSDVTTGNLVSISNETSVAVDDAGNVIVAGEFKDVISFNGTNLTVPPFTHSIFLTKFSPSGILQWAQIARNLGNYHQPGLSVKASSLGNIYLSHIEATSVTLPTYNFLITKFNSTGNQIWNKVSTSSLFFGISFAIDSLENCYLTGYYFTNVTLGNITLPPSQMQNNSDCFLAKLDAAGNWRWAKAIASDLATNTGSSLIYGRPYIAFNSNSDIALAGRFSGAAQFTGSTFTPSTNSSGSFIMRLDTAGTLDWVNIIQNHNLPTGISNTHDGNIFVSGTFGNSNHFGAITLTTNSYQTGFLTKITNEANLVTGKVFIDANNNGTFDALEKPYQHLLLGTTQGTIYGSSALNGTYKAYLPTGNTTLSLAKVPLYYTVVPTSYAISFSGTSQTQTGKDFALQPIPNSNDVKVIVSSISIARPGATISYRLTFHNSGTTVLSDTLEFQHDINTLTFVSSSVAPLSHSNGKMAWYYQNLQPNETRNIDVSFSVPTTTVLGTPLQAIASIKPLAIDLFQADNSDTLHHVVVGSYDPNDKQVDKTTLSPSVAANGAYLDYTIRFQNTGTDTAFTVLITDRISTKLNLANFEMLSASHNYKLNVIDGNMLEWHFNNILLPDSATNEPASHGFIRFRMPFYSLALTDSVVNQALIYFDYNAPVVTNFAVTKVANPTGIKEKSTNIQAFRLYPNPAKNYVMVAAEFKKSTAVTVSLVNLLGQTLSSVKLPANNQIHYQLSLNDLPKGVYLIRLQTETGMQTQRLVIQ